MGSASHLDQWWYISYLSGSKYGWPIYRLLYERYKAWTTANAGCCWYLQQIKFFSCEAT